MVAHRQYASNPYFTEPEHSLVQENWPHNRCWTTQRILWLWMDTDHCTILQHLPIQAPYSIPHNHQTLPPCSLHKQRQLLNRPIIPRGKFKHSLDPIKRKCSDISEHAFDELLNCEVRVGGWKEKKKNRDKTVRRIKSESENTNLPINLHLLCLLLLHSRNWEILGSGGHYTYNIISTSEFISMNGK